MRILQKLIGQTIVYSECIFPELNALRNSEFMENYRGCIQNYPIYTFLVDPKNEKK